MQPGTGESSREARSTTHTISIVDDQTVPVDLVRLRRLAAHVLASLDVPAELEVSITLADPQRITELNAAYLGGSGPTDVLAFPIDAPDDVVTGVPGLLGDVIICPSVAVAQAPAHDRTAAGEIDLLLVHGILHLLGHDHAGQRERAEMFGLTDDLLAQFAPGASPEP